MGRLKIPTRCNAPHYHCHRKFAAICLILAISHINEVLTVVLPQPCHSSCGSSNSSSISDQQFNQRTSRSISASNSENENDEDLKYSYRLFKGIVPEKYFLTITPILQSGFESSLGEQWFAPGHVLISVHAEKAAKTITLHAKNITIHNVTVTHKTGNRNIPVKNTSFNGKHSYMTIHLSSSLTPGDSYDISIAFTSYVSEVLNGLFRSNYTNEKTGEKEWFAATHMEALHARQMFPCFDEPSLKATIQAKVGRHKDYVALFNTESIGNETMERVEDWVWESFAPTVAMSTYLTALVIAKFQYAEAPGKLLPEIRVRTYAPTHYVEQGAAQYSANVAERLLYTYEEYFQVKYPMKKFDSVAVPKFLYGAMENFGLSIFRETLLLHFNNQSTESQRYIVTNVISHENAHQWFGNLVSPTWWTHLWLSEGLTKFTEYVGMNATVPEFKPWDIFVSESLQMGLRLDADSRQSHSLKIDEDAWLLKSEMEWFDDIAYKKGGSLIRMMQGFLSEPVLRKGLSRYLTRMKYKSAVQDDLFSDCEKEGRVANKLPDNTTLKDVMSGWTLQSGFPLLRVEHVPGTNNITVSQEKYFSTRAERDVPSKARWFIPVSIATSKNPNFDPEPEFWIKNSEKSVAITLPSSSWLLLNAGTTGFYRVIYDEELTKRITDQLMESPFKIQHLARSQLMDDHFNAAFNKYIPIHRALNLTRYMRDHAETENVVWTAVLSMLKVGFRLFRDTPEDFDLFKQYLLPRIEKAIHATGGFSAVDMNTKGMPVIRHAQLLDWACNLESRGCIDYATDLVKSWKTNGILKAPRDFRVVVLSAAVSNDQSGEMFDFIMDKYKTMNFTTPGPDTKKLKDQILTALSTTKNHRKIKSMLDSIFQPVPVHKDEDAATLLQNLATNVVASDIILKYFVENFKAITERFGGTSPITGTANAMAPHLKTLSGLFLMEELVKTDEGLKNAFTPVINRIRANIMWYDDFGEDMLEFFENNK